LVEFPALPTWRLFFERLATEYKNLDNFACAFLTKCELQRFVDGILLRMIFDGEQLSDLMAPLGLGWKARTQKELALMDELTPFLRKRAQSRDISGLNAYEQ
jgi:hypothetical protein